jgi:2',3'-cyclic-nucleotide 2'-phosphodiesterase (5'-nucleotidase family)
VEAERQRALERMSQKIGTLASPFELSDERECAAGNLLADALLERIGRAELALVLAGHWEEGLQAGELTQGTLFTAIRSTANPTWTTLSGEQILGFLREALKPENAARQLHALRGRSVGMPHIAGGRVEYDSELNEIYVEIAGKPLDRQQQYIVVSTDMEFSDYLDYLVIPFEKMAFEVPTIMPEVLEDHIRRHSPLHAPATGRIRLKEK